MNALTLKIEMLERQLGELKMAAETLTPSTRQKNFGDLYGICADGSDVTFEEIQAAKYQPGFDWLDEEKASEAA